MFIYFLAIVKQISLKSFLEFKKYIYENYAIVVLKGYQ